MSVEIKVLAIEDGNSFSRKIESLTPESFSVRLVGTQVDYVSAPQSILIAAPDVVALCKRSDLVQVMQILHPSIRFIHTLVLASVTDDVEMILKLGATGVCSDNVDSFSLVNALGAVFRGHTWVERDLACKVRGLTNCAQRNFEDPQLQRAASPPRTVLSERELSVLKLVAAGAHNREIASELYTSVSTIKNDIASIMAKLGVEDRVHAAVYAARHGLI